ncbi:aminopeptidase [Clostridium sp. 'deep sea']|uniref:aminopeptidase n=1 Tax=Clostridium sp. 'deep sea' TaxID=2779445 RepID=UPI00189694C1|nr:aminopeptidase [Clostridium sp. 'deep sea']QOR36266.1 aminopeptidase [Clostridium sp. 'deep sea']
MNQKVIHNYAKLIVDFAVKVDKGHTVVIDSPVQCVDFAREITKLAYENGAREVEVRYSDGKNARMRLDNMDLEVLKDIPQWKINSREYYANKQATFINIAYVDPDLYKGSDSKKMGEAQKASSIAFKNYMEIFMQGHNPWVVVAYPSLSWAKKVFPNLPEDKALEELWNKVLKAIRLDQQNPVAAWQEHKENIDKRKEFLNEKKFIEFKYTNSLGTDLTVGMPEGHIWEGVTSKTPAGLEYLPNIPTEEIFSLPHKYKVNGTLVSSMPLNRGGQLVEDFRFEFKDGKVVDYSAKSGKQVLDNIFAIDEGAKYLGEIALVSYNSPISEMGVMFYSTLFDENASCHFALGRAYPSCIKDGVKLTAEEKEAKGVNHSLTHVDFMVGTKDLSIIGVDKDGKEIDIFKNGHWTF